MASTHPTTIAEHIRAAPREAQPHWSFAADSTDGAAVGCVPVRPQSACCSADSLRWGVGGPCQRACRCRRSEKARNVRLTSAHAGRKSPTMNPTHKQCSRNRVASRKQFPIRERLESGRWYLFGIYFLAASMVVSYLHTRGY